MAAPRGYPAPMDDTFATKALDHQEGTPRQVSGAGPLRGGDGRWVLGDGTSSAPNTQRPSPTKPIPNTQHLTPNTRVLVALPPVPNERVRRARRVRLALITARALADGVLLVAAFVCAYGLRFGLAVGRDILAPG